MSGPGPGDATREVFFEFVVQGVYVKVTAIDSKTGIETSIVGAASAPRLSLEQAALRKLDFVLKKRSG